MPPDALVVGYEPLIATLTLPDPDDRHVLAAAIHGQCNALVTFDLKDFPPSALTSHGIVAVHPDAFLLDIATDHEVQFLASVKACRARLLNPTQSPDQHLAQMIKVGLPMLVAKLGAFKAAF